MMALKGFMARGENGDHSVTEAAGARAAAPAPRTVSPSTSVDASTELEGTLRCKETLRIDGRVKGEIECEKSVLVGEGAKVYANIAADEVQIAGLVKGDIAARRKITLERTAIVTGDLTTPGIVIEEGAKLKGRIVIGSEDEPVQEARPVREAKRQAAAKKAPTAPGPKPAEVPALSPA
jgi:cytoskeletal protein CcmA (bactofilin family)